MGYINHGESYTFTPDGRFRYTISNDGGIVQGVSIIHGTYAAQSDGTGGYILTFENCTETWRPKRGVGESGFTDRPRPDANRTYRASIQGDTLRIPAPGADFVSSFYSAP